MTVSSIATWRATPAHLRTVIAGMAGVVAALVFRNPALLVLSTPFAIVVGWSIALRPVEEPVLTGRVGPATVREGEATTWTGELSDVDRVDHVFGHVVRRGWIELRPPSGVVVANVDRSADHTSSTIAIPMRSLRWGRHDLGAIRVACVSSWGAFRWTALDSGRRLVTLPLPALFDAAPSARRANGLVGLTRSARPGDGTEFAGLRPFQSGDRLRRINWRRSLRSGELHVTSTYADQDTHVALFVDAQSDYGESGGIDGAASSIDTAVRAAGAIAEHFLLRGDRVSLRVFGSRRDVVVAPSTGRAHLRRILDALASVEPEPRRLATRFDGGQLVRGDALAIMFSPMVSSTALERAISLASHGLTVAVVDTLPDDVHASDDPTTELAWRIRLLERRVETRSVQRMGIPVITWNGPGSLDPFLREIARRATAPRMARR